MAIINKPSVSSLLANPLWPGQASPTVIRDSGDGGIRAVQDGQVRLAVVGSCFADEHELREGLKAVRTRKWTELTKWPGSHWTVADDGYITAVLTDVAGTRPVYFAEQQGGTAWSTSAKALAETTGGGLDFASLAAKLICPTVPEICGDRTAFIGVHRLAGGHVLLMDRDGKHRVERYEKQNDLSFDEAAEALRAALTEAVICRAHTARRLTADFSGGLDSTTLALLACGIGGAKVLAVTHADTTSSNEDVVYARRAADRPGLRHLIVDNTGALFFDDLLAAPVTDQPFADAARWRMRAAYQRPCVEHGSDAHLTGSGGDTLLAASPYYLADLARGGGMRALLCHARARARLRHLPVYAVVAAAVRLSRTEHALALRELARDLHVPPGGNQHRSWARLHWCLASAAHAWLTPDARDALARRAVAAAANCTVRREETSRHRAQSELREFGAFEAELRIQSNGVGLPHQAPYLDNAVVRAVMAIPVHSRQGISVQKPLLGAALHGLVPDWLLQRRTKGAFDGNAYTGLRRNAPVVRDLLTQGQLAGEGWIDTASVIADFDRLVTGVPGRLAALEALVAIELWLYQWRSSAPGRNAVSHA